MNRLQGCKRVGRECGLGSAAMTTTVGATGEDLQTVEWWDDAWNKIQQSRNWDFLWEASTVTILATTNVTTGSIPASRYEHDRVTDSNGSPLTYMPWALFTRVYPAALYAAGNPSVWTIRPDKAFVTNAKPTSNFAISVERYKNPVVLTTDSDATTGTPALPAEHHMLIVWRAVMLYAGHDEASELYRHANAEYKKVLTAMGITDMPAITWECGW